jgi:uncharacterized RDD family membrane protein YckC
VGLVPFLLLYTIPVLGFLVWAALLPMAVGAALLAMVNSLRRETAPRPPSANPGPGAWTGVGLGLAPVEGVGGTAGSDATAPGLGGTLPPSLQGTTQGTAAASLPRAGFWIRACATLLDAILVFWLASLFGPLVMALWVAYHVAMWMWKGTTVGGIVLGLKVVRLDGRPVDFATALIRSLSSFFSAVVLGLGFFWVGWDPERQSWHDRIAGTTIVRVPRGMSLI